MEKLTIFESKHLPANVLVKWDEERDWADEATGQHLHSRRIRLLVLPNELAEMHPAIDERSAFQCVVPIKQGGFGAYEAGSYCYPWETVTWTEPLGTPFDYAPFFAELVPKIIAVNADFERAKAKFEDERKLQKGAL